MKKSFSLFGGVDDAPKLSIVALDLLHGDPEQPRKDFDEEALLELAESIKENGILQAPLVRPNPSGEGYLIIAGERRCRAARLAGLTEIDVKIYNNDDYKAVSLIENLQRQDLKPVEEAKGLKELLKADKNLNQTSLAKKLGKNRLSVLSLLKIADLPEYIQDESLKLNTPKTILIELSNHKDENVLKTLWDKNKEGTLTVSDIRNYGKEDKSPILKPEKEKKQTNKQNFASGDKIIQSGFTWLGTVEILDKKKLQEEDKATLLELKNKISSVIDALVK